MDVREKLVELCKDLETLPCCDTYEGQAEYLIANGVTVQEWISVDDRLPEKYAMVLIYDGDSVEPSLFFGDLGFYEADKYEANPFCGVTHWMPLPAPPKGE